jgi:hypothetical protein
MKKENIISIVVYLVVFAVAIIYGFTVLQTHFNHSYFSQIDSVPLYAVYIIVSVISGVFVAGVLQEFGHFLGAKTGGYKIISWCLFYFTFYLDKDNKRKFKFASYDGLGGETKIVPNYEKKEKPNPYPYLFYGSIFNLAWIVICFFIFFTYMSIEGIYGDMAYYFLTMGIIATLMTAYNIMPTKLDSLTDGYRLTLIKKDVEGFNQRLDAENGGLLAGSEAKKIEKADENKPTKFIPEVAINNVYPLIVEKKYDEALKVIDEVLEHSQEANSKTIFEANSQKVFINILAKEKNELLDYYEKEVSFQFRRELSNDSTMPGIRTYMLTAGLLDGSLSEVLLALKKVVKAYKNVPNNRKHYEVVLFNEALDMLIEQHPKWEELPNYRLYE